MPPVYDITKHGIGLGTSAGTLKGFQLVPGSYRRRLQDRELRRVQIGKDKWMQDSKVSEWVHSDFSGGAYQDVMVDPSQFTSCLGMLPSKRNPLSLRTCQSLEVAKNGVTNLQVANYTSLDAANLVGSFVAWDKLHLLMANGTFYVITPSGAEGNYGITSYNYAVAGTTVTSCVANTILGVVVVGYADGRIQEYDRSAYGTIWRRFRGDLGKFSSIGLLTRHQSVTAVGFYAGKVVVAAQNRIFYYAGSDSTTTVDADNHCTSCAWTMLGDVSESRVDEFCVHRSELYILSTTGRAQTSIDMTTLVAGVLPWQKVPYLFYGQSLMSYAGRLYLGGAGYDAESDTAYYGQLFELTGNQFRELKVWYDNGGQIGGEAFITQIPNMCVFEGFLMFAHGGKAAVEAYDMPTDGFFTGYGVNTAYTVTPRFVFAWGNELVVFGTGTHAGIYYLPRSNKMNVQPVVELSELAVEPSLLKTWTTCQVHSRMAACALEVSVNGGYTWASATRVSAVQSGYNFVSVFNLSAFAPSATIKVRVKPETSTTFGSTTYYWREVAEVIVGFFIEVAKLRMWDISLVLAENLENLDGSKDETVDPDADIAQIWAWYDAGTVLVMKDRDGSQKTVKLTLIQENEPQTMGQQPGRSGVDREVFMTLQVAEVSYA